MPRCPSCFTPLTRVVEADIKSAVCPNCFGTWLNAGALLRKAQSDARDMAANPATATPDASIMDLVEVVQASNSKDVLRCGECERPMVKEKFHPMIPVQVDRCKHCNTLWLDAGELPLIRRLYAELMTTVDPEIQRRRDRVGGVAAKLQGRQLATQEAREALRRHHHSDTDNTFGLLQSLLESF